MSESLSFAIISTQRSWGGGEEQARQLADGLRQRGHRCLIVAVGGCPFAERMESDGFPVVRLSSGGPAPWRIVQLRRVLRRSRAQVVYFNDARAVTLGGLAAWRLAGAVTVAARRTAFPLRSPARYQWLCDRLFCVSRYAAELCAQAGFPRDRLAVVHDGVDPDRVKSGDRGRGRATLGLGDHETMLLHVGSLNACKGHQFLLDAMPAVLNRRPDAQLVLAGAGELEAPLREQAGRLNVQHRVRFLGFRHDVPDLIHACDLFVFPSICEGLGSTLIDVMLARRPIVTTLAGGIPDVVGETGDSPQRVAWISPPGQADELGKTIVHALEAPEENAAMVERAKVRAERFFTVDRMVEATLAGARAVLSRRGD